MDKHLSWFIGPKAENADKFSELLQIITQDYFHWRRNYFPDDPLLIDRSDQRKFDQENDLLYQNISEFLASLRRNFPFYNPRYIAHMLSDTSIPSMLGYFGAMLYNANNVTPEAAPVTTEWEIESCNDILKMLGYKPSPTPPAKDATINVWEKYQKELKNEFGWAHITSGGTVANIEALWVARSVKYAPLAIQEIAIEQGLNISVKLANHFVGNEEDKNINIQDIKTIDKFDLINVKTNESVYLLSKYIKAYLIKHPELDINTASKEAMKVLNQSEYSLANNMGKLLSEFPLAIFVSGTAHYSIKKAANILGIGWNNIKVIDIDSEFRANMSSLNKHLQECKKKRISPLAVIGIAGTTEEGAIDPIEKILDLREEYEKKFNMSFWLHIDAAWGGYAKTILQLETKDEYILLLSKTIKIINKSHQNSNISSLEEYIELTKESITHRINEIEAEIKTISDSLHYTDIEINLANYKNVYTALKKEYQKKYKNQSSTSEASALLQKIKDLDPIVLLANRQLNLKAVQLSQIGLFNELQKAVKNGDFVLAKTKLEHFIITSEKNIFKNPEINRFNVKLSLIDRVNELAEHTNTNIEIKYKYYQKKKLINVGNSKEFVNAFLAFKHSDSITIDPHKLGYLPYPNGVVAYKNDRVRHFITHEAPYITSSQHNALIHNPPRHVEGIDFKKISNTNLPHENYKIAIDAFAPFILEGSKPGASAASLWLSNKTIPLTRKGHGSIIKGTLLATRELYEWMISWDKVTSYVGEDTSFRFIPVSQIYPDLNVFVFVVKLKNNSTLEGMNQFVLRVYEKFSIPAEMGDKNHSYSQPFFLSKTQFSNETYNYSAFSDFFKTNGFKNHRKDYNEHGLLVLRATLMNPYIDSYNKSGKINLIKDFIIDLHKTCMNVSKEMIYEQ